MLPTNVMSFVKKMVTTQPEGTTGLTTPEESGTTFSKLRQLMVTGNVAKVSPTKVTPETEEAKPEPVTTEAPKMKLDLSKPASRAGACRVCLKSFKPEDFSRTCCECNHKVCEDCASYSSTTDSDNPQAWRCSVCRRKLASRGQPIVTQESTDSLLEVPVLEALQRRHSDAKLSCQGISQSGALGSGLAPPRSPDFRRHSDVSPASLKELEKFRKVAGERREELRWERELEWRSKSRSGSPTRHQSDRDKRATSPQRSTKVSPVTDAEPLPEETDNEAERRHHSRHVSRRKSTRMPRQHSYDDELESSMSTSHADPGLILPGPLPRRASAYDVFSAPGAANLHRTSISGPSNQGSGRRPSFRAVKSPYEVAADEEKKLSLDSTSSSEAIPPAAQPPIPAPDDERRTRRRNSQLPDINAIRALPSVPVAISRVSTEEREMPRQPSLADGEGIKIVIHDVDSDLAPRGNAKRKVILRRDPVVDKSNRTRGFGMRVVGGKTGSDGRMFAYIVYTVPGGAAEKAGLQQGDKVLDWCGVSLIDRTFEEVLQVIDRSGDAAELIVEHATDMIGDLLDEPGMAATPGKTGSNLGLQLETEPDKTPSSPTRRKLPKTPEQIAKERQVSGRIQIQIWYEADRKELVVSVLAADELCAREDTGYGTVPEAYAKLTLVPPSADQGSLKTDVAEPTHNPIWNATLNFTGITGEKLMERSIDVTLWDYLPEGETVFLGECTIDLQHAFEEDRAVWYRLEDPKGMRLNKSPYCSPRGSLSIEIAQRLLRRTDIRERSYSDDTQSDSGSPEPYFLHPDHAWHANSRRGSSQSEQLEIEPYELNKDYSRSLPGSRRSSFQSQAASDSKRGSMGEADVQIVHYPRERRRSSFMRPMRDPEEILEGLRSYKAGKAELGRTMSFSSDKRRPSRRGERKGSVMELPRRKFDHDSESDDEDKWSQSIITDSGIDIRLGPGQVAPPGFKGGPTNGEVQLAFFLSKKNFEIEVISARAICQNEPEEPDTYIKTYLRDEERWLLKRKTRVVRHSKNPQFRQTIKYPSCHALGRNLLVMLWKKNQGFESNQGLGGAEINLSEMNLNQLTFGWYILLPIHTLGTQDADSP